MKHKIRLMAILWPFLRRFTLRIVRLLATPQLTNQHTSTSLKGSRRKTQPSPCFRPSSFTLPSGPIPVCPAYTPVKGAASGTLAKKWRLHSGRKAHMEGAGMGWYQLRTGLETASDISAVLVRWRTALALPGAEQVPMKSRTSPNEVPSEFPSHTEEGSRIKGAESTYRRNPEESCVCTHAQAPARYGLGLALGLVVVFVAMGSQAVANDGVVEHPPAARHMNMGTYDRATLTVRADNFADDDTLVLYVWRDLISGPVVYDLPHRLLRAPNNQGRYTFIVDSLRDVAFFSVGKDSERVKGHIAPILEGYLLSPGDDISIEMSHQWSPRIPAQFFDSGQPRYQTPYNVAFNGKGVTKYQLRNALDTLIGRARVERIIHAAYRHSLSSSGDRLVKIKHIYDSLQSEALAMLDQHRSKISETAYQIMKAEVIGRVGNAQLTSLDLPLIMRRAYPGHWSKGYLDTVEKLFKLYIMPLKGSEIPHQYSSRSTSYIRYMEGKLYVGRELVAAGGTLKGFYTFLKDVCPPGIRDRVLTSFIYGKGLSFMETEALAGVVADADSTMNDPVCLAQLRTLSDRFNRVFLGNFSFHNRKGESIKLDAFIGKTVFVDFYYNACLPCKLYFKNVVLPVYERFKNRDDAVFLLISTDSERTFMKGDNGYDQLGNNLLNLYTSGKGFSHPMIKKLNIMAYPTPLLIGKDGSLVEMGHGLKSTAGLIHKINVAMKSKFEQPKNSIR